MFRTVHFIVIILTLQFMNESTLAARTCIALGSSFIPLCVLQHCPHKSTSCMKCHQDHVCDFIRSLFHSKDGLFAWMAWPSLRKSFYISSTVFCYKIVWLWYRVISLEGAACLRCTKSSTRAASYIHSTHRMLVVC